MPRCVKGPCDVPRLNEQDKARNEAAVRAAMECILRGDLPPGAKADLKTLAELSGVTRTGFYAKRNRDGTSRPGAYQHLAEELARRLQEFQDAGEIVDPHAAQIVRLKEENALLKDRIARRDGEVAKLTAFRALTISRLAAQHECGHDGYWKPIHTRWSPTLSRRPGSVRSRRRAGSCQRESPS